MRRLQILCACLLLITNVGFAQSNPFKDAEIPIETRDYKHPRKNEPFVRLLMEIYGEIKYPQDARSLRVTSILRADYTVLSSGLVSVDSIVHLDRGQLPVFSKQEELIKVINYIVPFIDSNGHRVYEKEPRIHYSFIQRVFRNTYGKMLIEREVRRVLSTIPRHNPATFCGESINWSYSRYFEFYLE